MRERVPACGTREELAALLDRIAERSQLDEDEVRELVEEVSGIADLVPDPPFEPGLTPDPDDAYLVALAAASRADALVSGDPDLTELQDPKPPVMTPGEFLDWLSATGPA